MSEVKVVKEFQIVAEFWTEGPMSKSRESVFKSFQTKINKALLQDWELHGPTNFDLGPQKYLFQAMTRAKVVYDEAEETESRWVATIKVQDTS